MRWRQPGWPWALIGFCTLWRLPGLWDPPWLNDEGTYANLGKAIVNGEAIYRQVWENKPPAVYLLYGLVHYLAGPAHLLSGARLLALLAAVICQAAVYHLARPFAGRGTALLAVALAGLLLDLPLLDGTSANAEIFLAAATSVGMALLWRAIGRGAPGSRALLGAAGVSFGLAIMFKLVAGADLLAALAMIWTWGRERRTSGALTLLAGACLVPAATAAWLAARGLLGDALFATVGYNRGYVTTGQGMHAPWLSAALLLMPLALIAAGLRLGWRAQVTSADDGSGREGSERAARPFTAAMCWWCGAALVGALASGRSYPHYFMQAVPPAAVCLALLGRAACGGSEGRLRRALVALLAAWVIGVPLGSWLASNGVHAGDPAGSGQHAYYAEVWQRLTGGLDATAFADRIDPRVGRNVAVARYLKAHQVRDRRLYVWGNAPWIYYLSGYSHAARFLSAYYNPPIPGGMTQVIDSLRARPPAYIVVIEPMLPASQALAAFVREWYRPVWSVRDAVVYRLR